MSNTINWTEKGYESREDYIRDQAESNGLCYEDAEMLADLLGDDELFDGFVTGLEDMSSMSSCFE